MAKLRALTKEKFTLLYNALPVVTLAKELNIDENPLMDRARSYGLCRPMGRYYPTDEFLEALEENPYGFRYPLEIMDILIEVLIGDGATDKELHAKGYPKQYIEEKRKIYHPIVPAYIKLRQEQHERALKKKRNKQ